MKKNTIYHLFLFLSTFTRGIVEVFSLVLLYKKGFSIENIFWFLWIMYTVGIFVNYFSLKITYKKILVLSSFLYGISFLYLSFMTVTFMSLVILAILLASSNYSYHTIRHLLAMQLLEKQSKKTSNIIIVTYLGVITASILGIFLIDNLPLVVTSILVFLLSFVAIIPILKLEEKKEFGTKDNSQVSIEKDKICFSILEQFKVIFLEIQPLFLYLYVENSFYYVGILNVIVNIASLIVVYVLTKKDYKKYFKYICLLLGLVFLLKLNLKHGLVLLGLAFLEGIFVKMYENVSLENLYDLEKNSVKNYLLIEELIFFGSKSLIMLICCIFHFNLYCVLYLSILGMIASGWFIHPKPKKTPSSD